MVSRARRGDKRSFHDQNVIWIKTGAVMECADCSPFSSDSPSRLPILPKRRTDGAPDTQTAHSKITDKSPRSNHAAQLPRKPLINLVQNACSYGEHCL